MVIVSPSISIITPTANVLNSPIKGTVPGWIKKNKTTQL